MKLGKIGRNPYKLKRQHLSTALLSSKNSYHFSRYIGIFEILYFIYLWNNIVEIYFFTGNDTTFDLLLFSKYIYIQIEYCTIQILDFIGIKII